MTTPRLTREICRQFIEEQLFKPRSTAEGGTLSGTIGSVGVELEAFPYRRSINDETGAIPAPLFGNENSVMQALVSASAQCGGIPKYWYPRVQDTGFSSKIESIGFPNGDRFSFEPGGQVEICTSPCSSIGRLNDRIAGMQELLNLVTQQSDIHFAQFGTNTLQGSDMVTNQLISPRYVAMENYFDTIGPYGQQMMLQTCSMHVNLDLGASSAVHAKRIVAANLLAPFATAIFANSSVTAGRKNGHRSYRSYLWQQLDTSRTGILPLHRLAGNFSEAALIDTYVDFALTAPLIYISELGAQVLPSHITFGYWIEHLVSGLSPTLPHFADHLSLLFPEVRLKSYIEIRSVDVPPRQWQLIPVIFFTGLLYNEEQLDAVLQLLLPLVSQLDDLYIQSTFGLKSDDIFSTSLELVRLAIDGFSGLPVTFKEERHLKDFVSFFENFTSRRKTFADEQLDVFNRYGVLI